MIREEAVFRLIADNPGVTIEKIVSFYRSIGIDNPQRVAEIIDSLKRRGMIASFAETGGIEHLHRAKIGIREIRVGDSLLVHGEMVEVNEVIAFCDGAGKTSVLFILSNGNSIDMNALMKGEM